MRCEKDDRLKGLIAGTPLPASDEVSHESLMGAVAFALSLVLLASFWAHRFPDSVWATSAFGCLLFFSGILMHLLAIFSQFASTDRNLPGALAIPVLYVGMILNLVIDHFIG